MFQTSDTQSDPVESAAPDYAGIATVVVLAFQSAKSVRKKHVVNLPHDTLGHCTVKALATTWSNSQGSPIVSAHLGSVLI
jgi:hypothetical protein